MVPRWFPLEVAADSEFFALHLSETPPALLVHPSRLSQLQVALVSLTACPHLILLSPGLLHHHLCCKSIPPLHNSDFQAQILWRSFPPVESPPLR